jgi:hypothetical protein
MMLAQTLSITTLQKLPLTTHTTAQQPMAVSVRVPLPAHQALLLASAQVCNARQHQ